MLDRLNGAGHSIIVDDFGTGYSSLSYLKKFPIDVPKIDRSFVTDLKPSGDNISICAAIVALAHSLNLTVIAEGVESVQQQNLLSQLRCDQIQGFYFCRPVNATDLEHFIRRYRSDDGFTFPDYSVGAIDLPPFNNTETEFCSGIDKYPIIHRFPAEKHSKTHRIAIREGQFNRPHSITERQCGPDHVTLSLVAARALDDPAIDDS